MELNPRAAAIAELVLWIGHLQWHVRTKGGMPSEPILRAFKNIVVKDAVLEADKPPRRPDWPPTEFIVGNPPFIGASSLRYRLGDEYAQALWAAHPHMNESADFVMYWWDRAADLLTRKGTVLRRFGLVTTNSISQVFQRRVIKTHLAAKKPMSIIMAIPDHPWTKAAPDAAAVRIAMTIGEAGSREGVLRIVMRETALDTDTPIVEFSERMGKVNSDLTVGVDVTAVRPLLANAGLAHRGVTLGGQGFVVSASEAEHLGLGRRPGLERHIRPFLNGRDLNQASRQKMVIDLLGMEAALARKNFPEVYQHLLNTVKPARDLNNRASYRENWWIFAEPRNELRPALHGLFRYTGTARTAKHRVFSFLPGNTITESEVITIGSDDPFVLGVLSSRINIIWSLALGGTLEDRPRYNNSVCFDPFPFPPTNDLQKQRVRNIAEDLDAHRERVLAEHPHLTLTGLYNVLEKLRAGASPEALDAADRRIFDDGLVLILKELHDKLDKAVADAYGWPADLADDAILARLVALNKERVKEEAKGRVLWLRPEYQVPRFGTIKEKAELELVGGEMRGEALTATGPKSAFPSDDMAQTAAVMSALAMASGPLDAAAVASTFTQGRRVVAKVTAVLFALSRMGFVDVDDGRSYRLRRAA